ncbi:hypothetical protein AgCh_008181 [Apium graveolens]
MGPTADVARWDPCCHEKSSLHVSEQCAWALGNVAGEGVELRNVLLAQGALPPLARMMLPDKGSAVKIADGHCQT